MVKLDVISDNNALDVSSKTIIRQLSKALQVITVHILTILEMNNGEIIILRK